MQRHDDEDEDNDNDRRRILRDGEALRVPMMMMDGMQRDIARQGDRRDRVQDGSREERWRAYRQYEDDVTTAWCSDVTGEFIGKREGDACTIRSGGDDEGSSGHLKMIGGKLICVADPRQDAAPTIDAKAGAYAAYDAWLQNAWRNP
jgi:hypothetical protein